MVAVSMDICVCVSAGTTFQNSKMFLVTRHSLPSHSCLTWCVGSEEMMSCGLHFLRSCNMMGNRWDRGESLRPGTFCGDRACVATLTGVCEEKRKHTHMREQGAGANTYYLKRSHRKYEVFPFDLKRAGELGTTAYVRFFCGREIVDSGHVRLAGPGLFDE